LSDCGGKAGVAKKDELGFPQNQIKNRAPLTAGPEIKKPSQAKPKLRAHR